MVQRYSINIQNDFRDKNEIVAVRKIMRYSKMPSTVRNGKHIQRFKHFFVSLKYPSLEFRLSTSIMSLWKNKELKFRNKIWNAKSKNLHTLIFSITFAIFFVLRLAVDQVIASSGISLTQDTKFILKFQKILTKIKIFLQF